ncbi:amidohydrolase [Oceanobacillus neutriphilus]|uniref:Deaminase n=1 Tax=Oceanobacillus neutriphilus TaxID=531815 RepID=A0ABQ2NWD1_9BACI|nr:amidohydrolase [Oceanobacillus neutriphilus]GGP12211.1 deaminase [Oceanobacillus neutriphilus]
MNSKAYWLTNATLETGYQLQHGIISGTQTDTFHIQIENGKIKEILPAQKSITSELPKYDAEQYLMLPSFRDMHIHLDKTYYGGKWKAPAVPEHGIWTRLQEEKKLIPELLPYTEERAKKLMDLLLSAGTTHIRSHCNVGPTEGLHHLEALLRASENYQNKVFVEIVAFPQQGMLRSNAASFVRDALRNGAGYVGGVDPASIDGDVEKSLQTIMELAVEGDANIDIHLHEAGELGIFTMKRLAALTEEAGWQGRVTLSHAFALADIHGNVLDEMAEILAQQGISIASSVSLSKTIPIPFLHQKGVEVFLGDDSITDHWSPFGKGDSLEKAGLLAERFGLSDERTLGQTLQYITGGITPLDENGRQVWPKPGDAANFVLADASCSAEAVARRAQRKAVFYQGNQITGSLYP